MQIQQIKKKYSKGNSNSQRESSLFACSLGGLANNLEQIAY